jgi:Putative Actinobacterial Holin-X, holin superfamily III
MTQEPDKLTPERQRMDERPLGEVLADLWHNFETAVRQELRLVSAELDEKTTRLKREVLAAVIAGAVLYAGGLAVMASLILLLAKAVAPWLAALLVGVAAISVGYALMKRQANAAQDAVKPSGTHTETNPHQTFRQETP